MIILINLIEILIKLYFNFYPFLRKIKIKLNNAKIEGW